MPASLCWSEQDSEAALALLASDERLIAPDLITAELCNAAWHLIRLGQMHAAQMPILTTGAPPAFARLHEMAPLVPRAGAIALAIDHPAYDLLLPGAERSAGRPHGDR